MKTKPIKFQGKGFFCDACRKLHDGIGYIYNAKGYCLKEYQCKFPKFKI